MRTAAALLVLPLLAIAPVPATALEVPPTQPVVVTGGTASGPLSTFAGSYGNGPAVPFGDSAVTGLRSLAASADGSRVVSLSGGGSQLRAEVRAGDGTLVAAHQVEAGDQASAVLSPSGNRLAIGAGTRERLVDLATGTTRDVAVDGLVRGQAFVTEDLLLVKRTSGFGVLSFSGSSVPALSGLDPTARDLSLDAAGERVVYVTGSPNPVIRVAPLTLTTGLLQVGTATTLVQGEPVLSNPVFTRNGTLVLYTGTRNETRVLAMPLDGSYGPYDWGPYGLVPSFLAVADRSTTPSQVPVLARSLLDGTRASLSFRRPTDPFAYAIVVTRTSPGLEPAERYVALDRLVLDDQGLLPGRTYTYTARLRTTYLENGPASTSQLVATLPPVLSAADPTSGTSTTTSYDLRLQPGANAADTRYSVDARVQGTTAWTRQATLATATSLRLSGAAGQTYAFRGQAFDRFDNPTAVRRSDRAVVPLDQQRAVYAGSTVTVPRAGAYGGTSTFLRAAGAIATLRSAGDRLQVVGERCPTCGAVDVYLDGVRRARVDTGAATRLPRQVLWTSPVQFSNAVRTLALRAVGTPGRPTVVVDAFGARRYEPPLGASLRSGETLPSGGRITSRSGAYYLAMQGDGHLALYAKNAGVVWLRAVGRGSRLVVQNDGNVVAYPPADSPYFQTATSGNGAVSLVLQDDGNLVLYRDRDGRPLWSRKSGRTY